MARFRYRMQGILDIKIKLETQARQEFAQAKIVLEKEEEKLLLLHEVLRRYEEEAAALLQGKLEVHEILTNKEAIMYTQVSIEEQKIRVEDARGLVEEARERLKDVMQERKVHETLKDKAFEEFLMEEKQQESKEIDELTSYVYGQKLLDAEEESEDVKDGTQTRF